MTVCTGVGKGYYDSMYRCGETVLWQYVQVWGKGTMTVCTGVGKRYYDSMYRCGEIVVCMTLCKDLRKQYVQGWGNCIDVGELYVQVWGNSVQRCWEIVCSGVGTVCTCVEKLYMCGETVCKGWGNSMYRCGETVWTGVGKQYAHVYGNSMQGVRKQ